MPLKKQPNESNEIAIYDEALIYQRGEYWQMRMWLARRYKAFRVSKAEPFNGFEDDADFVVWDGLYDAVVSYGNISTDGTFNGVLAFSSVEIEIDSSADISEFVRNSSKAQQRFFKDAGA